MSLDWYAGHDPDIYAMRYGKAFRKSIERLADKDGLITLESRPSFNKDAEIVLLADPKKPNRCVACSCSGLELLQYADNMPDLIAMRYEAALKELRRAA